MRTCLGLNSLAPTGPDRGRIVGYSDLCEIRSLAPAVLHRFCGIFYHQAAFEPRIKSESPNQASIVDKHLVDL